MNKKEPGEDERLTTEQLNELTAEFYHSTESIVAFIDILGFGNLVLSLDNASRGSTNLAFKAVTSLFQISNFVGRENPIAHIESSIFSDTIVLSQILNPEAKNLDLVNFFHAVCETQSILLHFGYLTRGGIAVGKCIHKNNTVLFGKAIIDAYHLEQEAKYPRVVISNSARQRMGELEVVKSDDGIPKFTIPDRYLRKDFDGIYFVDYLRDTANFHWEELKKIITSGLGQYKNDVSKYSKYHWLASYYNYACDIWNERFPVEKISDV